MEQTIKKKVYLATCYTFGSGKGPVAKLMMWLRYKRVTKKTAELLIQGYNVFSPITHSHPLPKYIPDRLNTHSLWLGLDLQWIDCCDELWCFCQKGWESSYGVQTELAYARKKGMPIRFIK